MYHRLAPTHSNAPASVFYGIIDMLQFKSRSFKNRKESILSVPQMATPESSTMEKVETEVRDSSGQ